MKNRWSLWLAIIVLASSSTVVRKIGELGAIASGTSPNPIQFCNVLFAGNLVAFAVRFATHRKEWTAANLRAISSREWVALGAVALLAVALAPALIFTALEGRAGQGSAGSIRRSAHPKAGPTGRSRHRYRTRCPRGDRRAQLAVKKSRSPDEDSP